MSKDDLVYISHMLDMGWKALSFNSGIEKSDYNQNESLRMALTDIVQIYGCSGWAGLY